MNIDTVRKHALALEGVSEEPHHHFASFRVGGKIFITVPPDETVIHLFVDEVTREKALAMYPEFIEKLMWGGKVVGIRVVLALADASVVEELVHSAHTARGSQKPTAKTPTAGSRRRK